MNSATVLSNIPTKTAAAIKITISGEKMPVRIDQGRTAFFWAVL